MSDHQYAAYAVAVPITDQHHRPTTSFGLDLGSTVGCELAANEHGCGIHWAGGSGPGHVAVDHGVLDAVRCAVEDTAAVRYDFSHLGRPAGRTEHHHTEDEADEIPHTAIIPHA